ncbi:MAG: hypothetical protein HY841_00290 [Bacteroidetes bacterium]|nr:hypothetical protein [Bacteroidota bacterium]
MKKIFLSTVCCLLSICLFSQIDMGLPVATGKGGVANGIVRDWECVGINPANLGWENNYRFSISTMIFGISAQSGAMDYGQLKNAILHPGDTFSTADKSAYAGLFSNAEGLNLASNIDWLTFSFRVPKVGGFAMNLRDRSFGHIKLNKNAAEILFMGMNAPIFQDTMAFLKNISTIFNGSKIGYMHYRELNLAYGAKLFGIGGTKDSSKISFYGGIGVKYLWGLADFEMVADNNVLTGHSAISSKYGVNYGNIKNFTPETSSGIFPSVGTGTAFDIGAGIGIGKIKITLSAVDMGKITWDKNVLIAHDTLLPDTSQFNFNGINSWDMAQQASQMFNDSGLIHFEPGPAYKTEMLSKFRLGVGWQLSKRMVVGADLVMPMSDNPANLENAFFAAGTEIELASNFKFSFGFAGNSVYKFSLPVGITLGRFFKICELRLATNDILTYLSPGSNPNISLSLSLFRFNVDKKK